ncbi:MAG: hypothetical protein K2I96_09520 [Lachnospiraceae bacterium]|nr:hypothetical protein [Lachnospiraceae bacterium]
MLIRILAGAYGHRPDPGKSYIEKKDKGSEPFDVSDKEAARLIGLGIAEKAAVNIAKELDKESASTISNDQEDDLEQLSIQKLRKMAKDLGLPADGGKAVLAEKIRNASKVAQNQEEGDDSPYENNETDVSDSEDPPILQAAEPEV